MCVSRLGLSNAGLGLAGCECRERGAVVRWWVVRVWEGRSGGRGVGRVWVGVVCLECG